MIGTVLIGLFLLALLAGMPLATGLGVASIAVLALAGFDQHAVPTNIYAGIAKYPLLAIPMFILAGMIFERSGVAIRLVRFVTAMVGEWTGSLAVVAVLVSMLLGGISGSGPADAAAVAGVMLSSMIARRYPKGFSAGLLAASRQSLHTAFAKVRKIRIDERRGVIHLAERLTRNQVYAAPEDFAFVRDFILARCPRAVVSGHTGGRRT